MKHYRNIIIALILLTFFTYCDQDTPSTNLKAELTSENTVVGTKEGEKLYINLALDKPLSKDLVLQLSFDTIGINSYTNGAEDYDSAVEYSTDGGASWKRGTAANRVQFAKGARSLKLRISTKDDTIPEIQESFHLKLKSSGDNDVELLNKVNSITCLIVDDEPLSEPSSDGVLMEFIRSNKGYVLFTQSDRIKSKDAKYFLDGGYKRVLDDVKKMVKLASVDIALIQLMHDPGSGLGGFVGTLFQPGQTTRKNEWFIGLNAGRAYFTRTDSVNTVKQSYNADGRFGFVLTHELGHLMTLNFDSQIDPNVQRAACSTYFNREGCAKPGSYINDFNTMFYNSAVKLNEPKFVSNYAKTNLEEDMAEVFAHSILDYAIPAITPTASGALRKIHFMKSKPGLYDLRKPIRDIMQRINLLADDKKVFEHRVNVDKHGNIISCLDHTKFMEILQKEKED